MKAVALVLVVAISGCSFVTARGMNKPHEECSRAVGRMDAAINNRLDPPNEHDQWNNLERLGLTLSGGTLFLESVQALYGLHVADECQAARSKLAGPAISNPGATR